MTADVVDVVANYLGRPQRTFSQLTLVGCVIDAMVAFKSNGYLVELASDDGDGERIAVLEGAATDDVVVTAAHYRNIATYISERRPFAKTGSGQASV